MPRRDLCGVVFRPNPFFFSEKDHVGVSVFGRFRPSFLPFLYQLVIYLLPDSFSVIWILIIFRCYVVFSYITVERSLRILKK